MRTVLAFALILMAITLGTAFTAKPGSAGSPDFDLSLYMCSDTGGGGTNCLETDEEKLDWVESIEDGGGDGDD